ncbi:prolyl oligopeptidase family serine peptidase [Eubacteriaceae bacterium ES2]|nr:prolyl oligopeptidase family serine peptidase [Eubacteriaceae bacterium ES2]
MASRIKRIITISITMVMLSIISGCETNQITNSSEGQITMNSDATNITMDPKAKTNSLEDIIIGSDRSRGFINDNVYNSAEYGDIHFSSYIPENYDGSKPYALFITSPGWEGLYFQGASANMVEDFGVEAINYNSEMIVISTQLNDWGETSAEETIALTEYYISHFNIDPNKVFLHGYSAGGETGSLVMGMRPELYTAYLMTSSKWDGDLNVLADAKTPVYLAIGENDSYYGSLSMKQAYENLESIYFEQGLSQEEISKLLVLDVRDQDYFTSAGFNDQHAGGQAFAHDEQIMGWLFGDH